jgi:hypothetical protein
MVGWLAGWLFGCFFYLSCALEEIQQSHAEGNSCHYEKAIYFSQLTSCFSSIWRSHRSLGLFRPRFRKEKLFFKLLTFRNEKIDPSRKKELM